MRGAWLKSADTERGASLISALLLVAVMASMAMMLAGELRTSLRRSANMEVRDQAYWYAMGAREFAGGLIGTAMQDPEQALRPDAAWLREARTFPIERGALSGRISDGNNCFNINGLVVSDGQGGLVADEIQRRRFERLMRALGLPSAEAGRLAAEATDWIDSDSRPLPGGGEDAVYADRPLVYRTGNTLMAEREELLALASMTPAFYRQLAPHVCARPVAAPVPLNINTMQTEDCALLVALFVPLVLAIAQFFLPMQVLPPMGFMPDSWLSVLVDPGGALDSIKDLVRGGDAAAGVPDGVLLKAWISVALWTLLPAAGAIAWFNRQDLSKE